MAIQYYCRHCGVHLGKIDATSVETNRLGFQLLSDEERLNMITYKETGDVIVKAICEDCQESLVKNPDYYENDYIIH